MDPWNRQFTEVKINEKNGIVPLSKNILDTQY